MSRIDFATLIGNRPNLKEALVFIQAWIDGHPTINAIDTGRLARDAGSINKGKLSQALDALVDSGFLERTIGVLDPEGALLQEYIPGEEEIPDTLPAADYSTYYATDDLDLAEIVRERA